MKKFLIAVAALAALVSCKSLKEEWDPVFTFGENKPEQWTPISREAMLGKAGITDFTTIAEMKALYKGVPVVVSGGVWIEGQVTTSDQSGNIYNEMYLQDATGAIDLKIGRSALYNEFKLGQWVYVKCDGLTLGSYNGQLQLGFAADDTTTNEYDTSYIQLQSLVEEHVFRGEFADAPKPLSISANDISRAITAGGGNELWGKLVTVEGLTYGNEVFALFYPNPNMAHKSGNPENRIFLSDAGTWGVNTWACTKGKYVEYIQSGVWDSAEVGSGATRYGNITGRPVDYLTGETLDKFGMDMFLTYKEIMVKYASANYISHYFNFSRDVQVQVRTSGYAKFADTVLSDDILAGKAVNVTGIITNYNGAAQMTLIDEPSISVVLQ